MICFFYFVVCPLLVLWYFIQFQQYLRVFDPIPPGSSLFGPALPVLDVLPPLVARYICGSLFITL